jgi:hypothetical protein
MNERGRERLERERKIYGGMERGAKGERERETGGGREGVENISC